ncbi:TPA: hypothetical protein N0F65_005203 [Lagenidium giganteum]|uniref:LicD/FKTN/FKRP nucleotidyltransferase domain-containing protein n=1 Tax=Lagenidium giganteum TaxID=4803 RepID=A0AAV2YWA7_9STRA|nr:TPA: hypothetical protein N0F65_005203 [Lagenidium giganteum]
MARNHRERRLIKDVCYTREEIQDILRNLVFNATTVLAQHNVSYFLESGTLLGSFREQGLIKHDVDGDLGIDVAGYEYLRHNKVEVPPEYIFGVFNSTANPRQGGDIQLPIRLIHIPSALYVDVFVFLDWDGKDGEPLVGPLASVCFLGCVGCRSVPGGKELRMPRDWVYPLVDCPFEGRTMKCPNQSDKYLKYMCGPSYMKSDK